MEKIVISVSLFVILFLVYTCYLLIRYRHYTPLKVPVEVKYLTIRYKIDMTKVQYRLLLIIVGFISSFDVTFVLSIALLAKDWWLQFLLAFILFIPLILISYHIVGKIYQKKGR